MLALLAHPAGEHQRMGEDALQLSLALDLAHDVARDPAEIGADRPQRPVGALELLGVGIALVGDQRVLADPLIGLAQAHAGLPGELHQPLARPMHELGVGRKGDRLGLNCGVDDHLGEVRGPGRAGARGDRKALLDQRRELLLAHPLAPARQRRAVEGQLVPEELLAVYGRPRLCKDFDVPTDGSLAIVYPAFGCGLIRPLALMGSESSTPFHRIALKVRGEDRDWSSPGSDRLPSRRCPSQVEAF